MVVTTEVALEQLKQLDAYIQQVDERIKQFNDIKEQAFIQRALLSLFISLSNNPSVDITVPVSKFVHVINEASALFSLQVAGVIDLKIHRDNNTYTSNSQCYFYRGELETLCKDASFDKDGNTTISIAGYYVKLKIENTKPIGAQIIHVAEPTAATVPIDITVDTVEIIKTSDSLETPNSDDDADYVDSVDSVDSNPDHVIIPIETY